MTLSSGIDDEFILIHIFCASLPFRIPFRSTVCVSLSLIVGGLSVKWRHLFYHTHHLLRFEICTHTNTHIAFLQMYARTYTHIHLMQCTACSVSNWKAIVSAQKKMLKIPFEMSEKKTMRRERKFMVKMKISQCIWQIYYWKIACAKFTQKNASMKCRLYIPSPSHFFPPIVWVPASVCLFEFVFISVILRCCCCCCCWCSDLYRISIETWIIFLLKKRIWYVECCISIAL